MSYPEHSNSLSEIISLSESILHEVNGIQQFKPGRAVIVYGQKKSGKTSLVYQIKNYIKACPVLKERAIIINFNNILDEVGGIDLLQAFKRSFYANILSRFEDEIYKNHKDIVELLECNNLEIPDLYSETNEETWVALFDRFFRKFFGIDNSKHVIILFMDEFTLLCTAIMDEIKNNSNDRMLATIPNFIKTFSASYGFIQILIGHDAMIRVFDYLGVRNHTSEFAKSIEIASLDYESSKKLIIEPMERVFGFNPYTTALGQKAVERLLDLSGRHPTYLMRLCNKMFDYYLSDTCQNDQLVERDVDNMLNKFIDELLLQDFDILLVEDGDKIEAPEERKTYEYLKVAAVQALKSYDRRAADRLQIDRALTEDYFWSNEQIEKITNLLEARRVISIQAGGRVKINAGLFIEYIDRKLGGK